MKPKAWSMSTSLINGAVCGAIYGAIQLFLDPVAARPSEMVGFAVGTAVGGALLFGIVALIRNMAAGAR